jgi:dihydrofolate reductase
MSKLRYRSMISLDGYVAGADQSERNPLGVGGMQLAGWAFELAAFHRHLGLEGGVENASTPVVDALWENIGATVMGRNMFGGHPGGWDRTPPWNGWWGNEPPFHHPVFVLTHHARAPLVLGETTFTFVTDGIESALAQARTAARGRDVSLGGGAHAAQQYLRAGLVDEMVLHLVPVLLGAGERLFDGTVDDLHGLALSRAVPAPGVVHLVFERAPRPG